MGRGPQYHGLTGTRVLADRGHLWVFIVGCLAVTAGVLLHRSTMYWIGCYDGLRLADVPMDAAMVRA